MAAKVADNITNGSVTRLNLGSRSMFILDFFTENLDDTDTIDVSNLLSNCEGAWVQPVGKLQTSSVGVTRSGTGNTTLTMALVVNDMNGQVFIIGTP